MAGFNSEVYLGAQRAGNRATQPNLCGEPRSVETLAATYRLSPQRPVDWPAVIDNKMWEIIVGAADERAFKLAAAELKMGGAVKCWFTGCMVTSLSCGLLALCACLKPTIDCIQAGKDFAVERDETKVAFELALAQVCADYPGISITFDGEMRSTMQTGTGDNRSTVAIYHDKLIVRASAEVCAGATAPVAAMATAVPISLSMPSVHAVVVPLQQPAVKSVVDEIKELAQLKADGVLTEAEFTAAKAKLVAGP